MSEFHKLRTSIYRLLSAFEVISAHREDYDDDVFREVQAEATALVEKVKALWIPELRDQTSSLSNEDMHRLLLTQFFSRREPPPPPSPPSGPDYVS